VLEDGRYRTLQMNSKMELSKFEWVCAFVLIPYFLITLLYDVVKDELVSYTAHGKQIEKEYKEQQAIYEERRRIIYVNYQRMVKIHESIHK